MVKIRLTRTGKKNAPTYRIVVTDARSKRDGRIIEKIGFCNLKTKPPTIKLDKKRLEYWLSQGAQMTNTVKKLAKKEGEK